jgi:hypothetical protein
VRTVALAYLLVELVASGLIKVARVGKERKPVTPRDAVGAVVEVGLMIWAVTYLWGAS